MRRRDFLSKWEYKLDRLAIPHLMTVIVGMMAVVFVLDSIFIARLGFSLSGYLAFDRAAVLSGQIWRLITFAFLPPDESILFILFALYFYYMIGEALEREWGSFRFNIFYLCGLIGSVIGGFIAGGATNMFLNLSLFLAFAILFPEYEILLFFVIPVKVKYIAFADMVFYLIFFILGPSSARLMILFSLLNLALFFFPDIRDTIRRLKWNRELKKRFRR